MEVSVGFSKSYGREDRQRVLNELQGEFGTVVEGQPYFRRSVELLSPVLVIDIDLVREVAALLAAGLVGAISADIWNLVKRVVVKAARTKHDGRDPDLIIEIHLPGRSSEIWLSGSREPKEQLLSAAIDRVAESRVGVRLQYSEEHSALITFEELLAAAVRRRKESDRE